MEGKLLPIKAFSLDIYSKYIVIFAVDLERK